MMSLKSSRHMERAVCPKWIGSKNITDGTRSVPATMTRSRLFSCHGAAGQIEIVLVCIGFALNNQDV
jgi:hypothetical protein